MYLSTGINAKCRYIFLCVENHLADWLVSWLFGFLVGTAVAYVGR